MQFNNPYLENVERIELLQRWLIVHSIIYYEMDKNVVSDIMFDNNCRQLIEMKNKYKKSYKNSFYYPIMKDFDGSTGFHLSDGLKKWDKKHHKYLSTIATHVIKISEGNNDKSKNKKQIK